MLVKNGLKFGLIFPLFFLDYLLLLLPNSVTFLFLDQFVILDPLKVSLSCDIFMFSFLLDLARVCGVLEKVVAFRLYID